MYSKEQEYQIWIAVYFYHSHAQDLGLSLGPCCHVLFRMCQKKLQLKWIKQKQWEKEKKVEGGEIIWMGWESCWGNPKYWSHTSRAVSPTLTLPHCPVPFCAQKGAWIQKLQQSYYKFWSRLFFCTVPELIPMRMEQNPRLSILLIWVQMLIQESVKKN